MPQKERPTSCKRISVSYVYGARGLSENAGAHSGYFRETASLSEICCLLSSGGPRCADTGPQTQNSPLRRTGAGVRCLPDCYWWMLRAGRRVIGTGELLPAEALVCSPVRSNHCRG